MDPPTTTPIRARDARPVERRHAAESDATALATRPISVVITVRDDAWRLRNALTRLASWCERTGRSADVIVVDDGSKDDVSQLALCHAIRFNRLRVLRNEERGGKGSAVRAGLCAAQERAVLVCDSAFATPLEDAERLLKEIDDGAAVAVGSRSVRGATILRPERWKLRMFSALLGWLARELVPTGIADASPSLIALDTEAVRPLVLRCGVDGHVWAVELFAHALRAGLSVKEVPVRHAGDPRARLKVIGATFEMMRELTRLAARLNAIDATSGVKRTP